MITPNAIGWTWHSEQGATCVENRDACGIYCSEAFTLAIIMDASPRGERGAQFNATWIHQVFNGLTPNVPSVDALLAAFQSAQRHLRIGGFMVERASYTALLLPRAGQEATVFSCGDCMLGYRATDGDVEWLTQPHTLANALEALGTTVSPDKRHIVTRTLNARRYTPPEVVTFEKKDSGPWMLATDGYCYLERSDMGTPLDDCSYLLIGPNIEILPGDAAGNLVVWHSKT